MTLWHEWLRCVDLLRTACARRATFLWMCVALAGFSIRSELAGVTSFVRALWLKPETPRCQGSCRLVRRAAGPLAGRQAG